jgi:UDP-3-O-[3-hydroxymyristoyl] glucosamine N-acyltransferase
MITLGELAQRLALDYSGDPALPLYRLAPLERAEAGCLSFIASSRRVSQLRGARAGAVILRPEWREDCPVPHLLSDNPYLAYARASQLFEALPARAPGVHPSAVIHAQARLGEGVCVGPCVVVEAGADIGPGVVLEAGCIIAEGASIGARTRVFPNAVVHTGVRIGEDCRIHAGAVIGADGFGFARHAEGWERIAQLGSVRVGNRVRIGAGSTVDRGALEDTVLEDGVIIDNQVQIAHNCRIGKNTAIAGCSGIAGSTTIGENCTLAGAVGVSGHLEICDNVHLTGQARVTRSVTEPGTYASGTPLAPTREWARNAVRFTRLDELQRRLEALEKVLSASDNNKE